MTDHLGGQPGPIETTVATGAEARTTRSRQLDGALPVIAWLDGVGRTPNSGKRVRLPVAVVDLASRPDVADLARVWAAEQAGDPRWTGHVVTGWTAMLDGHGTAFSAPLICGVRVTRPVACAFRLRIDYLRDTAEVRLLERTGWIGLLDAAIVADVPDDATLDALVGAHTFSWRFRAATLAAGMREIDGLLAGIGR
jgi:hypothetical protein